MNSLYILLGDYLGAASESLSPAVRSAIVAHIIKYEVYRHRRLVQTICASVGGLDAHLTNRKRSRTTWEVILFLCKCYLHSETTTTDIFLGAGLSKGTAITCINRLTKHNIVEKIPGRHHRRQRRVSLTTKYKTLLERFVVECFEEFQDVISSGLQDGPVAHPGDLLQQLKRAENGSRSKSAFIAHLSHDLREPLNAVLGFSQALKSEIIGPLHPSGHLEFANGINASALHLLELVNDLADISQFELNGDVQLDCEIVDVIPLLKQCLLLVTQEAKICEVKLTFSPVGENPLHIDGDPVRTKRAVLNLLNNAVRYTPKGGKVQLAVIPSPDGGVEISVADNGFGIPEDLLDTVVEPYKQGESNHARMRSGNGLGLSFVKSFVEIHGGKLTLESVHGNGTTARIWFPTKPPNHIEISLGITSAD